MVHILLKPGLENFKHYFTSMWDECNCVVVWAFFGIAQIIKQETPFSHLDPSEKKKKRKTSKMMPFRLITPRTPQLLKPKEFLPEVGDLLN